MNHFTRIDRIERHQLREKQRLLQTSVIYTMPDRSQRILSRSQSAQAYVDALDRTDSPHARVVLNAVTDSRKNDGLMLQLLWAVMHPVNTEPVQQPVQHENDVPVTT
jgi:hypothetical protein